MDSSSQKITLIIFAKHHLAENIASRRFKALIRHLRDDNYDIHVFSQAEGGDYEKLKDASNVTVHSVPGYCVGDGAGRILSLLVFLSAKLWFLPFIIAPGNSWLSNAIGRASQVLKGSAGRRSTAVVATYSPIDALVAARCLAKRYTACCILDFRDGFVFESLGRTSPMAKIVRKWVEHSVAESASLITTVSQPLVEYFRDQYPDQSTELLPNGFDLEFHSTASEVSQADDIMDMLPSEKFVIGHFGRIGGSDRSRLESLRFLVKSISENNARENIHLLFVGELEATDLVILDRLHCTKTLVGHVAHNVARTLMSKVDALLLITGGGVGCATGKLFEYMIAGPPIACFTVVRNEAASILESTGCGQAVITSDNASAQEILGDLMSGQVRTSRNQRAISRFNRSEQAKLLNLWIRRECGSSDLKSPFSGSIRL